MSRYKLFPDAKMDNPATKVSQTTDQEGGTMRIKGGALIDGQLNAVTIISTDGSPIKVSALAKLSKCVIECQDILIEGEFSGQITAKGDVEFGESGLIKGTVKHGGMLLIGCLTDYGDVKAEKLTSAEKPTHGAGVVVIPTLMTQVGMGA
jgi:Polymer-forming cytoskeletal